jgi:hypothetical protein
MKYHLDVASRHSFGGKELEDTGTMCSTSPDTSRRESHRLDPKLSSGPSLGWRSFISPCKVMQSTWSGPRRICDMGGVPYSEGCLTAHADPLLALA